MILLFGWEMHEQKGGFGDFISAHESIGEAVGAIRQHYQQLCTTAQCVVEANYHLVNQETWAVVARASCDGGEPEVTYD